MGTLSQAILLGVIIDAYWVVSKEKIKRERQSERVNLAKAWNELLTTDDVQVVTEVRNPGLDIQCRTDIIHCSENYLNLKSVDDQRLAELFVHLRPNYSSEEHQQMIEWLDTDGNGTVNRSEWILSLLEVLSFGFADEILQNTPKHSKILEEQDQGSA